MHKFIFTIFTVLLCAQAQASLTIICKTTTANVTSKITLDGSVGQIVVSNDNSLYFDRVDATYNKPWESVTMTGGMTQGQEAKGVKMYFQVANPHSAAIRPYGATAGLLFPGSEANTVYGMTCDQDYNAILAEVLK